MTLVLLICHGTTDWVDRGILAGRSPHVHLNRAGMREVEQLAERLACCPIDAVWSSPLERAIETAAPIAERQTLDVRICEGMTEIDFGDWTGREIRELAEDPQWLQFNHFRSGTRIPGGELIVEVQERMVTAIEQLHRLYPEGLVAAVSHGDVIKSAIAYYAGIPLDLLLRIRISPSSVSVIAIDSDGPEVLGINGLGEPVLC